MDRARKNPHAVGLGRLGGKIGGPARAAKLTAEERTESARKAGAANSVLRTSAALWEEQLDGVSPGSIRFF